MNRNSSPQQIPACSLVLCRQLNACASQTPRRSLNRVSANWCL
nr:MAG TPA: hypothetical protein [Caudoviricetes sp.]